MFAGPRLRGLELCLKAPEVLMAPLGDMEPVKQGLKHTGCGETALGTHPLPWAPILLAPFPILCPWLSSLSVGDSHISQAPKPYLLTSPLGLQMRTYPLGPDLPAPEPDLPPSGPDLPLSGPDLPLNQDPTSPYQDLTSPAIKNRPPPESGPDLPPLGPDLTPIRT